MKIQFTATAALTALLAAAAPAHAVNHYTITDLGIVSGAFSSLARAISGSGIVGGESNFSDVAQVNRGTIFGSPPVATPDLAGGEDTYVRGMNNSGVAAATVQTLGGNDRVALLTTGSATQLGGLAGYNAAGALDINNASVAVGYVLSAGASSPSSTPINGNGAGAQRAVSWSGGVASLLAAPTGSVNSVAVANNDSGTATGMYRTTNNQIHAVVWTGGVATELAWQTGQNAARTRAISEAGWVAGQTSGALGAIATVWSPTQTYSLRLLPNGDFGGAPRGINSAGTVIGFGSNSSGGTTAMLWDFAGGSYNAYDLASLVINGAGWNLSNNTPQAINDAGQIVGFGLGSDDLLHSYILNIATVPEPASWALLVGGFGTIGGALRRRRATFA